LYSPDGTRIATLAFGDPARLWDAATGALLGAVKGHGDRVVGASFSPDWSRLATRSLDRAVRVWDASNGVELMTLAGHEDMIWDVAFSPDGLHVATASADGTARIWRVGRTLAALAPMNLGLAASLTNGRGVRTEGERADPLMQSAPDDLFAALMDKLSEGKSDVEAEEMRAEVARRAAILDAPRHLDLERGSASD
jgi:hypothetical protein